MRIIGGRYKGRKIRTVKNAVYRPTLSRIRKSLFDTLGQLDGLSFLDLYAGTGIMGFEGGSRGAEYVEFVENNYSAYKILQENITKYRFKGFHPIKKDVFQYLRKCRMFNIIFADPPYDMLTIEEKKNLISLAKLRLESGGVFIFETNKKDTIVAENEKVYGDTKLLFWRQK